MQTPVPRAILEDLRAQIARLERGHVPRSGKPSVPFGIAAIDGAPKSLGWRLRARVGTRKAWHNQLELQE